MNVTRQIDLEIKKLEKRIESLKLARKALGARKKFKRGARKAKKAAEEKKA